MLRSFCFALLGLGLLAAPATAQTTPAKASPKASARSRAATVRRTNRANNAAESEKGQSGYAAPGEPITSPNYNGKNTPPYDGPAAPTKKGTTLTTPK